MLGRQNRELAYSRSLLSNHVGQLQHAIRNVRQENVRLRETLCSVLRYHRLIAAAVRRVIGDMDIESDSVVATTQQDDKEEHDKQEDEGEEETNTEQQVHDNNTTRLISASASEMAYDPPPSPSSPVAKSSSPRQQRQSTQATMSSSARVNKETWRKYLMLLSPINERDREEVVVRKPETMRQQERPVEPPLHQSARTRRSKVQKSYRLPNLKQKLRKGDPFTYT